MLKLEKIKLMDGGKTTGMKLSFFRDSSKHIFFIKSIGV